MADRESHLVPVVLVIGGEFFSNTVGRQAEEVVKTCDGEDNRERPPPVGLAATAMVTPANAASANAVRMAQAGTVGLAAGA